MQMKEVCAGLAGTKVWKWFFSIKYTVLHERKTFCQIQQWLFLSWSNLSLSECSVLNFGVFIYRNDMNLRLARFWIHNSYVWSRCSQVTVFAPGRCFQNEFQIAQRLLSIMNESNTSQYITKLFCALVLCFHNVSIRLQVWKSLQSLIPNSD